MNDQAQQLILYIAQVAGVNSEEELQPVLQALALEFQVQSIEDLLNSCVEYIQENGEELFLELVQTVAAQGTQMARFGAKINYFRFLKGQCPPGMQIGYYKKGGKVCKKCIEKGQTDTQPKVNKNKFNFLNGLNDIVNDFREERKDKKMKKKEDELIRRKLIAEQKKQPRYFHNNSTAESLGTLFPALNFDFSTTPSFGRLPLGGVKY